MHSTSKTPRSTLCSKTKVKNSYNNHTYNDSNNINISSCGCQEISRQYLTKSSSSNAAAQRHRDTEDDDLRDECSPPLKGEKKREKKPPYALGINNLRRTKAESKLRRKQNLQREGFCEERKQRVGLPSLVALHSCDDAAASGSHLLAPTCRHPRYLVPW